MTPEDATPRPPEAAAPADAAPALMEVLELMAWLRHPERGCPWDIEQDFASIAPYTIEEAFEVADAIERGDLEALREELGDLLLQVVFHARMAEERRAFDFAAVARDLAAKLRARHPHVFGSETAHRAEQVAGIWEQRKEAERLAKAARRGQRPSVLDDVAAGLPALMRAVKLQKRAARVGFDWPETAQVLDKIEEEICELRREIAAGAMPERLTDELGDVLFAVANLARHLHVDAEAALRHTNAKFERRFRQVEDRLAAIGRSPAETSLADMEALWVDAKRGEGGR